MKAAIFTSIILAWSSLSQAHAESTPLPVCPFKASELQAALDPSFTEGKPGMEYKAGQNTIRDCRYSAKNYSLRVGTTIYPAPIKDAVAARQGLAGTITPIPNDPDGAAYQDGQGDNTSPTVHYVRGNVAVELRILGIYYKELGSKQKDLLTLREKLAKLRRVP